MEIFNIDRDRVLEAAIIKAGSQKDLSSVLQCTQAYICQIKKGSRCGPIKFWEKVFKFLDLRLSDDDIKRAYVYIRNNFNYKRLVGELDRRGL